MRDPRLSPKAGDEIRQPNNGSLLRVSSVDGESVEWLRKSGETWIFDNSWSLKGWVNVVAKDATVVKRAK